MWSEPEQKQKFIVETSVFYESLKKEARRIRLHGESHEALDLIDMTSHTRPDDFLRAGCLNSRYAYIIYAYSHYYSDAR